MKFHWLKYFEFNSQKIHETLKTFAYFKFLKGFIKGSFIYFLLILGYRQIPFPSNYEIISSYTPLNEHIKKSIMPLDYVPTIYMPNCLTQMIYNESKSVPEVKFNRQYISTYDEGVISLDWVIKNDKDNSNTTINSSYETKVVDNDDKLLVILHGLTGGSEATYIRETILKFQNIANMKIVVINYRGVSGTPLLTPLIYHAGFYQDLYEAMKFIREKHPNLRCYALGTSMGANIFSKLLGNIHEFDDYVKGFISISNPFNCLEVEKRNRAGILDKFMIKRQIKYLLMHQYILKDVFNFEKISDVKLYRQFDEFFTCKLFGFKTVEEYYEQSSSHVDIPYIEVPSIFINSKDDLLSPIDTLDFNLYKENKNLFFVITKYGGHVCWFHGFFNPERWFIDKSINFVLALEKNHNDRNSYSQNNIDPSKFSQDGEIDVQKI